MVILNVPMASVIFTDIKLQAVGGVMLHKYIKYILINCQYLHLSTFPWRALLAALLTHTFLLILMFSNFPSRDDNWKYLQSALWPTFAYNFWDKQWRGGANLHMITNWTKYMRDNGLFINDVLSKIHREKNCWCFLQQLVTLVNKLQLVYVCVCDIIILFLKLPTYPC